MLYLRRGVYYLLQSELDKAMDDFNDTILHDPANGLGFLARGGLHYERYHYKDAIVDLTEAGRLIPSEVLLRSKRAYVGLYGTRGQAFLLTGNFDSSISDLSEAILIETEDDSLYYYRGKAYQQKRDYVKATKDYDAAIRINSTNFYAYHSRASIFHDNGELEKAIGDYSKAILIKPNHADLCYNRAIAFRDKGDFDKALSDLNNCIRLRQDDAGYYSQRAYLHLLTSEFEQAIKDYTAAIRLEPNDADSYQARGYVFHKKGAWVKAKDDYARAISLASKNTEARNELAWLLATCPVASVRSGAEAVLIATKACELSGWQEWSYIGTLAAAYAESGDFESAVKYQKQLLSMKGLTELQRTEEQHRLDLFQSRKPYRDKLKP